MCPVSTSRQYHHGDLRSALVASASKLLQKQGLAALSLREAARRAGVSHNAPYRHFADREALLAAVAEDGFRLLALRLEDAGLGGGRDLGEAYVAFALEHPQLFRLMFGGQIPIDRYPALREQASRAHGALSKAFSGVGSERDAANAAAAAWSLVHGLAQLLLDGHLPRAGGADPRAFAHEVIGAIRFAVGAQRSA
ncbi:MAG: hypothetical protein A3G83_10945 [Betaproteobacteria bacterium RIFCSPLOWO2_12_FULL_68_20]|nr:MAG: hypothetical protein A3G83_10945 [Betaproteobacteria bacterium RIFCSPLOWO2_12_FULL_68_20]